MAAAFNPFNIFRKYQKSALALITLLSMFAFVCVGPAMMGRGTSGDPNQIPPMAKWKYGDISRAQVGDRLVWRERINRFLQNIRITAVGLGKVDPESRFDRFLFEPQSEDGILRAIVLAKKAELLGITVSDKSINDYINAVTNSPLKQDELDAALVKAVGGKGSAAQWSDPFFEAMRFELSAKNLTTLLLHDAVDYDTPEARWDYYSRIHRAATVQVLPVAVKDLVGKISDPDNAELEKLYDEGKDRLSRPEMPEPGFRVPPRGTFQYFKAERATLAKADEAKITDKEIDDYYAAHKENFRKSTFEDSAFPSTGEKPKADDKTKTGDKPKTDDKAKTDDNTKTDDKSKTETPKASDKPAADAPKSDAPKSDAPKTEPPKTDVKTKSNDKLADPKSTDDKSSYSRPVAHHFGDDELLALADPASTPAATPSAATPPAATPPAATPPDKSAPPSTPPATTPPATTPPAATPATTPPAATTTTPATTAPATTTTPSKTETPKTPTATPAAEASKNVEYDPVTDPKVRSTIRTTLASQKAATEINEAFTKLRPAVQNYSRALSLWRAKGKHPDDEPPAPDFKELAKSVGLSFEQTKMVSADEAKDTTDLGKSTQLDETNFRLVPFSQIAFDANLPDYMPSETASPDAEVSYLWWRSAFTPSYIPAFADAKSDVMHAWKMIQARKLALAEANKYAEEANRRQSTLKEIFQIRPNMTVKDVGPFHWLSVGNMPMGDSMQQYTQVTQVSGLDFAELAFMRTVFSTDEGKTAVAFNQPETIAYVVQVEKIEPSEDIFRRQFQAFQVQSENSRDPGLPYEAANRDAQGNVQRKLGAIYEELGFKLLASPSSGQGSTGGSTPVDEGDSDD